MDDPIAVLLGTLQALERAGIEAAAYGGLALAFYGEPRKTKDADDVELIERELEALAMAILDHDIKDSWKRLNKS